MTRTEAEEEKEKIERQKERKKIKRRKKGKKGKSVGSDLKSGSVFLLPW